MSYKILGIVGSPRHNSNTGILVREALKGAAETGNIETEIIELAGKKILPCYGCFKCVEKKSLCIFKDKDYMGEIYEKWLMADGIIIGSPVYHLMVPGILKNVIDRLGEGIYAHRLTGKNDDVWFCKAGGVITQGLATFGGQEPTAKYLVSHLMVMNCLVVPAEKVTGGGVCGTFYGKNILEPGHIGEYHPESLQNSRLLGKRIAEVVKIIKNGVEKIQDELPNEYKEYVLNKTGYDYFLK